MTLSASSALAQYGQPPQEYPAPNPAMQELARQAAMEKIERVEQEVEQNPALLERSAISGCPSESWEVFGGTS